LIVDDEPIARRKIMDHLASHADIQLVGECADLDSARREVARLAPELLFLDLRLPGGNGLAFLRSLGERAPICIFVTALRDSALEAFDLQAVDYLLKPFDDARFSRSLDRARFLYEARHRTRQVAPIAGADVTRLTVSDAEGMRVLRADQIDWIEAHGNYVALHVGARQFLVRSTLERILAQLPPTEFLRVSRSSAVNLDRIVRLEPWMGRRELMLVLSSGAKVKLSRSYRAALETRIATF
jgi:two-component system LytT family response regulator